MLTVMTWNVRYFGHALRGLRTTEHGLRRAAAALSMLVPLPDLVALQEVETTSFRAGGHPVPQLERFLDVLHQHLADHGRPERYTGLYYPAHAYRLGRAASVYTTGLAVLVGPRLVVEAHNAEAPFDITHVRLNAFRRLKQKRIVAHVRVRKKEGGPAIDLFNTHFSLPAFLEVGPHKVPEGMGQGSNQLAEVGALLDYVNSRTPEAAILVGDFNTAPSSAVYRRIVDAGLQDAFAVANDLDPHELVKHATAGFASQRMHIDHVFSTPNVAWSQVEGFHFGATHEFHGISDHTPKIGRFSVRPSGLILPGPWDVPP
jgi:endonuclease/exonuclease/phosphatase family metal-dependent hydrolase